MKNITFLFAVLLALLFFPVHVPHPNITQTTINSFCILPRLDTEKLRENVFHLASIHIGGLLVVQFPPLPWAAPRLRCAALLVPAIISSVHIKESKMKLII